MKTERTWVSVGDFIDLKYKFKQRYIFELLCRYRFSGHKRTVNKWDNITPSSDFWIIPEVRSRWNEKCTGNPDLEYEDYLVNKYFSKSENMRMLSVGCGTGARERKFAKYKNFGLIEGIDMAPSKIEEARANAFITNLKNIRYHTGDSRSYQFEQKSFDIILFNSSLHHFDRLVHLT